MIPPMVAMAARMSFFISPMIRLPAHARMES